VIPSEGEERTTFPIGPNISKKTKKRKKLPIDVN
jgi:hypothetical protein